MKIQGKLACAPELRFTQSGKAVCIFTLSYGDAHISQPCEMWEEQGEAFAGLDLTTGDTVAVVGPVRIRTYEDREGATRTHQALTVREYAYRKDSAERAVTKTT